MTGLASALGHQAAANPSCDGRTWFSDAAGIRAAIASCGASGSPCSCDAVACPADDPGPDADVVCDPDTETAPEPEPEPDDSDGDLSQGAIGGIAAGATAAAAAAGYVAYKQIKKPKGGADAGATPTAPFGRFSDGLGGYKRGIWLSIERAMAGPNGGPPLRRLPEFAAFSSAASLAVMALAGDVRTVAAIVVGVSGSVSAVAREEKGLSLWTASAILSGGSTPAPGGPARPPPVPRAAAAVPAVPMDAVFAAGDGAGVVCRIHGSGGLGAGSSWHHPPTKILGRSTATGFWPRRCTSLPSRARALF